MDVRKIMRRHISGERLFHSSIISGGSDEDRAEAAKYIAEVAVCENPQKAPCGVCRQCQKAMRGIHPDITTVERKSDKKEITVDVMREVRRSAGVLPNEASRSVYIIKDADLMNPAAQNAMLKAFEEPEPHAVFVLTASNPERLIPTVRSRCEELVLPPAEEPENPLARELCGLCAAGKSAEAVRKLPELEKLSRQELTVLPAAVKREALSAHLAGRLSAEKLAALEKAMDRAEKYLAANVSAPHLAGTILSAIL